MGQACSKDSVKKNGIIKEDAEVNPEKAPEISENDDSRYRDGNPIFVLSWFILMNYLIFMK